MLFIAGPGFDEKDDEIEVVVQIAIQVFQEFIQIGLRQPIVFGLLSLPGLKIGAAWIDISIATISIGVTAIDRLLVVLADKGVQVSRVLA